MSPVELLKTPAKADASISPLTWKQLITKNTGQPAPTPDGKNIWIDIDINFSNGIALFHCMDEEHVHDQKPRFVTFRADHDCLLTFTNRAVFDCEAVQLFAHTEKALPVGDDVGKRRKLLDTSYSVYILMLANESVTKTEMKKTEIVADRRPPVIVVP